MTDPMMHLRSLLEKTPLCIVAPELPKHDVDLGVFGRVTVTSKTVGKRCWPLTSAPASPLLNSTLLAVRPSSLSTS